MDWHVIVQSVIAMLVITSPPDPAKILLFNSIIEEQVLNRTKSALKVAVIVFCILGGAALGGDQIAKWMGIDLNAFSVVGGIVVAGMGFEMLYGGGVSKTHTLHCSERPLSCRKSTSDLQYLLHGSARGCTLQVCPRLRVLRRSGFVMNVCYVMCTRVQGHGEHACCCGDALLMMCGNWKTCCWHRTSVTRCVTPKRVGGM